MPATLSLSSKVEVFPCPNCHETINTSLRQCPNCSAAIDPEAAEAAAAETSRISAACSDASYLKIMAWMLLTFFAITFMPFFSLFGAVALWFLRFAIPVMSVRWWATFGKIQTNDPDFSRAKRAAMIVSVVGVLALADGIVPYLINR